MTVCVCCKKDVTDKETQQAKQSMREWLESLPPNQLPLVKRFTRLNYPEQFADWIDSVVDEIQSRTWQQ